MPTRRHVPEGEEVIYSTTPPTSGDHWPRWADCGFYEEELPDELIVHNLEHSIMVISYNLTQESEVDELRNALEVVGQFPTWGMARFYDEIPPGTIVLAAWGALDRMDRIDSERIDRFFAEFAGKAGPEKIPCDTAPSA